MVFVALVLFTVSALATHIDAAATDQPVVHHACEGNKFCAIKPKNYPQEEIDNMLIQNLPHLHRMRREVIKPAPANPEGNCAVTDSRMISPFTLKNGNAVPQLIVQSKWFEQKVPQVSCKIERSECFSLYTLAIPDVKTECVTKKLASTLVVYNTIDKTFDHVETDVEIDCACVVNHGVKT